MTAQEIIATIRAEIEGLIERYGSVKAKGILQEGYKGGRLIGYEDALNILKRTQEKLEKPALSDLEKSGKPTSFKEAMKKIDEKIALVKQRETWGGANVDKYMDELRGREESEKPINHEGLQEEIARTYHDGSVADTSDIDHVSYENIAEYFYELGCRRTAEKYDEIEYNRQRSEESEKPMQEELDEEIERYLRVECSSDDEPSISEVARHFAQWGAKHASGSSEIPKDLEEAANVYSNCYSNPDGALARAARRAYITGAKWDKEQMMKEAVECDVIVPIYEGNDVWSAEIKIPGRYKHGDKVHLIVLPKED